MSASIPAKILDFFEINDGSFTTSHIAGNIGVPTKSVSSAVTRLIKSGALVRNEDGTVRSSVAVDSDEPKPVAPEAETEAEEAVEEPEQAEEPTQAEFTETVDEELPARTEADLNKMKDRIRKMLRQAEGTNNEHERDTFNEAAEKLMIKLGIARAELEAEGEVRAEEIVEVVREWRGNYSIVMVPFVSDVAYGFGNLTVLQSNHGAMLRKTYVIGFKSDVEAFLTLIDSLALQVLSALRVWQRDNAEARRGLTDMQKYVQHRSFITGFGHTVSNRLSANRTVAEDHASTGAALVLASKKDRIGSWIDETYPKVGKARGGMQYHSSIGMEAGREAGHSANLGGTSVEANSTAALEA